MHRLVTFLFQNPARPLFQSNSWPLQQYNVILAFPLSRYSSLKQSFQVRSGVPSKTWKPGDSSLQWLHGRGDGTRQTKVIYLILSFVLKTVHWYRYHMFLISCYKIVPLESGGYKTASAMHLHSPPHIAPAAGIKDRRKTLMTLTQFSNHPPPLLNIIDAIRWCSEQSMFLLHFIVLL